MPDFGHLLHFDSFEIQLIIQIFFIFSDGLVVGAREIRSQINNKREAIYSLKEHSIDKYC